MTDTTALRNALSQVQRGLSVAKLGLARDGVQHAKIVQMEEIIAAALDIPSLPVSLSILEDAIAFIESLTAVPLLMGDDIEMRLEDVQAQAKVEAASLRKRAAANPSPAAKSGEAEALRERIARALNSVLGSQADDHPRHHPAQNSWEEPSEVWWTQWLEAADSVVAALATPSPQPADAVREAMETARDYISDAAAGALTYKGSEEGFKAMAAEDLARLDAAIAALTEPAPAGEAVEPRDFVKEAIQTPPIDILSDVMEVASEIVDRYIYDWNEPKGDHAVTAIFVACRAIMAYLLAHPASEDTARLREDLERVTRENATLRVERHLADNALVDRYRDPKTGSFQFPTDVAAIVRRLDAAERDRDDVRKALEMANALISDARSCWWSGRLNAKAGRLSFVWDKLVAADDAARSAFREATIASLSEALAEAEKKGAEDGWMPIETAPRDGSIFLGYVAGFLPTGRAWVSQCKWVGPDPRYPNASLNWYMWQHGWPQPTHWRPLPPPPRDLSQGGSNER